jgi:methionine-rich copper-binding protein CopC
VFVDSISGTRLLTTCLTDLSAKGTNWVTFSDGVSVGPTFSTTTVTPVGTVTLTTTNGEAEVCVGVVTNAIGETNVWPQVNIRAMALADGSHTNWGLIYAVQPEDGGDMEIGDGLSYTVNLAAGTYRLTTYIAGRRTDALSTLEVNDGATAALSTTVAFKASGNAANNPGENDGEVVAEFALSSSGTATFSVTRNDGGNGGGTDFLGIRGAAIEAIPQSDTNAPVVLSVQGSAVTDLPDTVVATFDEPVDIASASFVLTNSVGAGVALSSTNLSDGDVVLTFGTGPLVAGETYGLSLSNVQDNQPIPNVLAFTNVQFTAQGFEPQVTIDWRTSAAAGASNLVYSLDGDGLLTGGAGVETFGGFGALASNFSNILTLRAYDALEFTSLFGVVVDLESNDYVEATATNGTWDASLGAVGQEGFGFNGNGGVYPRDTILNNNSWPYGGGLLLQLDFTAPTTGGKNMKISFTDQNTLGAFEVGDTERTDGTPADSFSWTIAPGTTISMLVRNIDVTDPDGVGGDGRRLQTCTLEFLDADTNPPVVVDIQGRVLFNQDDQVLVSFDEAVDTGAASFSITNAAGSPLAINNTALSADQKVLTLTTDAMSAGTNYFLDISGLKDLALVPNTLNTNVPFVAVEVAPVAQINWKQDAGNLVETNPVDLVYSIDALGQPTGGIGVETFSGAVQIANAASVLTVRAYDLTTNSTLDAVVADTNSNDWIEAAVSGTGWDASLVAAEQVGFGFHDPQGLTPGSTDNTFAQEGSELLVFEFSAPTNGGYFMLAEIEGRGQQVGAYEVGDTEVIDADVVGQGGSTFSAVLAPGESKSFTLWNAALNGGSGSAKQIRWAQVSFFTPQPTLTITESGGTVTVSWDPVAGSLQSAPAATGPWDNLTTESPYVTPASGSAEYYRVQVP